jgi:hypothetical protein
MRPGFEVIAAIPVMYLLGQASKLGLTSFLVDNGIPLLRSDKKTIWTQLGIMLQQGKRTKRFSDCNIRGLCQWLLDGIGPETGYKR